MSENSTIPAPAARRERALKLTVAASIGAKVFSVACTFAQVPIALRYLGSEGYGLWITLVSILMALNFVDFGLGVGMQHAMAHAYGEDDSVQLRRVFWTGTAFLAVLATIALIVAVPAAWLLPWSDLLHLHEAALREHAGPALALTIIAFAVGLPFNAVSRLAAAVQRGWWHAAWIATGSFLSLLAVAWAAWARWGFLAFLAMALLVPTVQGLGLFIHLCRILGWSWRPTALLPRAERQAIVQQSLFFALPQTGLALLQTLPAVAIATASGAAAVTGFNVLMRLLNPLLQVQIIFLTPLWPAYTEAQARGEHAWIQRMLRRSLLVTGALLLLGGLVGWQANHLVDVWLGSRMNRLEPALVGATTAWCVLQLSAQPFIYFLVGLGRLKTLAIVSVPGLVLGMAALFWPAANTAASVLTAATVTLAIALLPPLVLATLRTRHVPSGTPIAA